MPIDAPQSSDHGSMRPRTGVLKRSLVIAGHRTSISLEDAFWRGLKALAKKRCQSINALVAEIDAGRGRANLSSAIRLFVFESAIQ
jgi:predicted DNA-binding ribbon-helix-helix protein